MSGLCLPGDERRITEDNVMTGGFFTPVWRVVSVLWHNA